MTRCQRGHIVVYAVRKKGLLVVLGDEGSTSGTCTWSVAVERLGDILAAG